MAIKNFARVAAPAYVHASGNADPREAVTNALQKILSDILFEAESAVRHLPPGADRVCQGLDAYLDGCLRRPSMRVLLAALDGYPRAQDILKSTREQHQQQLAADLHEMSVPLATAHARLIGAMARETHRAECEAGGPLAIFRDLLYQHIGAL